MKETVLIGKNGTLDSFTADLQPIKRKAAENQRLKLCCVVRPGFEPGQAEPKSAVLPLHYRTIFPFGKFRVQN
jgi:hypothetical protein